MRGGAPPDLQIANTDFANTNPNSYQGAIAIADPGLTRRIRIWAVNASNHFSNASGTVFHFLVMNENASLVICSLAWQKSGQGKFWFPGGILNRGPNNRGIAFRNQTDSVVTNPSIRGQIYYTVEEV